MSVLQIFMTGYWTDVGSIYFCQIGENYKNSVFQINFTYGVYEERKIATKPISS